MSPADDEKDEVETEVVDETTLEETPVEPEAEATETEDAPADAVPAEVAEEPVAEAEETADAPPAAAPKPARKPAPVNGDRPVVRAHAKYVRTSARKARLVCDHIRGKTVTEARAILAHTPRAVAEDWQKLLESAVANAEHNHELLGDDLRILSVTADEGPTLKRFQPRAMGRASRIRKRTSHLSIALTPKEQ
jgi:ribosomal protein L22